MPSRNVMPGDTVYLRATALEVASDGIQVTIDDGVCMAVTIWVPARECARLDDIGNLRPSRCANPRHIER